MPKDLSFKKMTNQGLIPTSTYEQALAAVQREEFQKGLKPPKPPLAKIFVESIEYQNLDPASEAEMVFCTIGVLGGTLGQTVLLDF